jgi:hypothetical protein
MHKGTNLEHPKLLILCKRVEVPPKAIMDLFRLVSLVSMKKRAVGGNYKNDRVIYGE